MKRSSVFLVLATVMATALASTSLAAPIYMKLDGVDGSHEVESSQLGQIERQVAQTSPKGGLNIPLSFSSLNFTKRSDKASPKLLQAATKGKTYSRVEIHVSKTGGSQPYMTYKLENCQITSYQLGGAGGAGPTDSFSINFSKVAADYRPVVSPRDPALAGGTHALSGKTQASPGAPQAPAPKN